jgi:putative intracellular protease/amidase
MCGYLITGQNPASAKPLANEVLDTLKHYVGADK